jgi:hypothetical protein
MVFFLHYFEDPFAVFMESASGPNFLNFVKIESACKFLLKSPSSRLLIFPLKERMQGCGTVDEVLPWLHWVFDFTLLSSFCFSLVGRCVNKLIF